MNEKPDNAPQLESLETSSTVENTPALAASETPEVSTPAVAPIRPTRWWLLRLRSLLKRFNIYLLIFCLIIVTSIFMVFISIQHNRKENTVTPLTTQTLTADTLKQLKGSQATIGDPKKILSVESNAIFAGTVLVRQSLDVAGEIKVGGGLSLAGITVGGTSTLDQLQANSVVITGNATVQKGLSVAGSGSFGGSLSAASLNINTLHLNGDLQLNRHIDAGGGTPSKSDGGALGSGGTSSVSGTDTAGTVTISTGGSPAAGCFVTVNFSQKFNATPHVVITPVGSAAANLNYYINRTSANFSICATNAAPAANSFSFDYVAID